jgi:adenine deaminase
MTNSSDISRGLGLTKADSVISGGRLVNVITGEIYDADIAISGNRIAASGDVSEYIGASTSRIDARGSFLVPGFIDGHIHFESSKMSPTMFARMVLPRGTTSVITSADQVAGAAGLRGLREILDEFNASGLRVFYGASSNLPMTNPPSTIGFPYGPDQHRITGQWKETASVFDMIGDFIVNSDPGVLEALDLAAERKLPVQGGLSFFRGTKLNATAFAGVRLDHESYSTEEALEKLRDGFYVIMRDGQGQDIEKKFRLIRDFHVNSRRIAIHTDGALASEVLKFGHIDHVIRKALAAGIDAITAIQMATINCAEGFRIDHLVGSITPGRFADILFVDDLRQFNVRRVITNGVLVAADNSMVRVVEPPPRTDALVKPFPLPPQKPEDFPVRTTLPDGPVKVRVMEASREHPFVKTKREAILNAKGGIVLPDIKNDVIYASVIERFKGTGNRAAAFIGGFHLSGGALATSLSPDDNNIVAIGVSGEEMAVAVNEVLRLKGGQVLVKDGRVVQSMPLPIAGVIGDIDPYEMAEKETLLEEAARGLGCDLEHPFESLMLLSIVVYPDYGIIDKGLVDSRTHQIVSPVIGPA